MTDNRIALLEALHPSSGLFYPTRIFVSHDVRQLHVHSFTPNALDDVKIGAANTGTSDPDENIGVPL